MPTQPPIPGIQFSLDYIQGSITGGSALAVTSNPNSSTPAAAAITRARRRQGVFFQERMLLFSANGTTVNVNVWQLDETSGYWILQSAAAVGTGVAVPVAGSATPPIVPVFALAQTFVQVVSATCNWFGYGYQ